MGPSDWNRNAGIVLNFLSDVDNVDAFKTTLKMLNINVSELIANCDDPKWLNSLIARIANREKTILSGSMKSWQI